ncbi:hypothetical protein C021_00027, partial [Brucella abortus NI495a]
NKGVGEYVLVAHGRSDHILHCPTALLPYCPTALLPYCPTALLPYCPTALLPYCPTALLPYSSNHRRLCPPAAFFYFGDLFSRVDQWGQRCLRVEIMFCRIGFIAFDIDADGRA